jgi:hypothetical protein
MEQVSLTAKTDHLDTLAQRAKTAFDRSKASRTDWVASTFELADILREAKETLPSNQAFGVWLAKAGLETISKDDRSALIGISVHADDAREVFERCTDSWSWRLCWDEVRRVRSLRRRKQTEEAATAVAPDTNVVPLRPAPTDEGNIKPLHSSHSYPKPSTDKVEQLFCDAYCNLSYAWTRWSDDPGLLVEYWRTKRGDGCPSPEDVRDLAMRLEQFAQAIENRNLGADQVSPERIDGVNRRFANLGELHGRFPEPDPIFVAYQGWVADVEKAMKVVSEVPPEVKSFVHNHPESRRAAGAKLTKLSESTDWLRSEFHDLDREAG